MKFLLIFVLIFIKLCESTDLKCGLFRKTQKSVEFYCENSKETPPVNCTTSSLYLMSSFDKSKVTQLKIGGCDEEKIVQLVNDFQNIYSLNISNSGLSYLKPFNRKLNHLIKLDVSHNRLIDISRLFCEKVPKLMEANFSYNDISHVSDLPETLKRIDLSHNNMSMINFYELTNLPNLEFFDLSHNILTEIDQQDIFIEAKHLKTLRLEDNRYTEFTGHFLNMIKNGVEVLCSWEYVETFEFDENVGKPIRIVTNSQIEGVRSEADGKIKFDCHDGSFQNVKFFKFTKNHIENPGDLLRCLTPLLQELTLSGQFSEKINSTLFERFDNLTKLTLNDELLTAFDFNSLKNMRKLKTLDISRNNLKELQGLLRNPRPYILELNLSGNYVGELNASTFQRFFSLNELNLSNTNLTFNNLTAFEPLKQLKTLDISHNNLNNSNFTPPSSVLKGLKTFTATYCNITNASDLLKQFGPGQFMEIDLSGNPLGVLENLTFENVTYLRLNLSRTNLSEININFEHVWRLDLSHNSLKSINLTATRSRLVQLHLNGNELTEADQFTQKQFPFLNQISISNNEIPCKCLARFLNEWPSSKLIDNPMQQKHRDCSHVIRFMNNLGFAGDFIVDLS